MCRKTSKLWFNTLKNEKMIPQEIKKIAACTRACREHLLGFEVHTAVVMESCVFWNRTPCRPLEVNRRFRGRIRQARNQHEAGSKQSRALKISIKECFLATLFHLYPF
jgi:hypothetical protein